MLPVRSARQAQRRGAGYGLGDALRTQLHHQPRERLHPGAAVHAGEVLCMVARLEYDTSCQPTGLKITLAAAAASGKLVGWQDAPMRRRTRARASARVGRAGVQALARLVVKLRAEGISKPVDVAAALAGPIGQEHADPFTGKPMRFDPSTGTVGFEVENEYLSGVTRAQRERYGRMALRL